MKKLSIICLIIVFSLCSCCGSHTEYKQQPGYKVEKLYNSDTFIDIYKITTPTHIYEAAGHFEGGLVILSSTELDNY